MGQFSWITQDTDETIRCNSLSKRLASAYMHDNKGNVWYEKCYEGYGEFGGKDYFVLLGEMNDLRTNDITDDKLRSLAIDLVYSGKPFISPNLTRRKDWEWINEVPEDCPNQGWSNFKRKQ